MRTNTRPPGTVLIIDDDPEICEALELAATMEGYEVCIASDEAAALDILDSVSPSVILLDYYIAGQDIQRFAMRLRESVPSIPIVLMTGARDPGVKAKELGIKHVLPKPFDIEALSKLLRRFGVRSKYAARKKECLAFSLFA
ncbi:MAG TPA: response regulator [Planctomycetota bacterium]|nr:response regulator [Planctomycetota bacterium]